MIKIIIADDHKIFSDSLKLLIQSYGKYKVIAQVNDGNELIEVLEEKLPDIVLLDINMPIMKGDEAAKIINKKYPSVKILVLSMDGNQASLNMMIEIGIKGFMLKESSSSELEIALDEVYHNGTYFSQELLKRIVFKDVPKLKEINKPKDIISKREVEILKLICMGWSNIEIGKSLFISSRTVEIHKGHILSKTKCKNSVNLVIYAIKNKIVEIDVD